MADAVVPAVAVAITIAIAVAAIVASVVIGGSDDGIGNNVGIVGDSGVYGGYRFISRSHPITKSISMMLKSLYITTYRGSQRYRFV